ncbi:cytochrome P450 [Pyrenochaeta sp. MPI-SDFR-AT-0127]|nr:cytochrome P450 [Pyrenochaeta sp. MPI-SDFR-AT-0127]
MTATFYINNGSTTDGQHPTPPVIMPISLYPILVTLVALLLYRLRKIGYRPAGYPPGPPTLPLIGNLHLMPKKNGHLQFQKWAKEYGPIYSLILGTKEYGETWRMIRKIIHNNLNIKAARTYIPYQDLENKFMLVSFLEAPNLFIDHIRRYTNSLTTQMVFGFRTTSNQDPKLKQLFYGFEKFSAITGTQTAALLDIFPILRVLPDFVLPLRRYAKELHKRESALYIGHWLDVKKTIKNGSAKPCFCLDLVRAQDEMRFSDALASYISGSLLEAGSDTTAATLVGFVQAMVLFPEIARAAQEELDRVCGDRFPTLDDEPHLPYIRACVKESMRWMPTDILGIPHAVIRDDEYMGYTIPKGAGVMWNVWTIHMDPKRHPDPRRFDPARYVNDNQTAAEAANNADPGKRDHFVFGAGRRLCQGMHIAERTLFLGIARMLWGFDFHPARAADGNNMMPNAEDLTEGLLVQPKPFSARIVPRNSEKVARIKLEWSNMAHLLDGNLQWKVLPKGMIWKEYK